MITSAILLLSHTIDAWTDYQSKITMLPVMDFYRSTDPEEWTSIRIAEHNHAKPEKKGLKLVLDGIKKDLEVVAASNGFDMQRRNKAQQIVNEWKSLACGRVLMKTMVGCGQAGTARPPVMNC
ncbi:hypothetical protein BC936DRAFT_145976 [Jimgerdemannia flammicorona]|uniref:Uncharacterized protein n=1 Tax=Jimgerdemannia flammicorona TaxID=994334 RepID=A0A433DND6_9FUNG|nr:hypothetical protein BC936DRAFT_145976 [Jimgerdemannia flammicorona]